MAEIRVTPKGIEIDNSYEIKDVLKKAGYKFEDMTKAWIKPISIDGKNDPNGAMTALAELIKEAIALGAIQEFRRIE